MGGSEKAMKKVLLALFATLLFCLPAHAEERIFGAWAFGNTADGDGYFALTVNDSKAVLGRYCFLSLDGCLWVLANDIDCDIGSQSPVLANSDTGARSMVIACRKIDGKLRFVFSDFEAFESFLQGSKRISIAFPMRDGYFLVSRFLLDGAEPAIAQLNRSIKQARQAHTKDTRL